MKKSIVLLWKKYRAIIGIFLLFLILLGFLSSRAYFSRRDELKSFQIVVGNLVYQLSSSEFSSDNKVKISSGETKLFTIEVESLNEIDSKYELYYQWITSLTSEEKANLEIGYSMATEDMPSGEMAKTDKKTILISIENNTGKDIEISFGVEGGLVSNELVLKDDQLRLEKAINYVKEYASTEQEEIFITPTDGYYQIELWGAQGGDIDSFQGGRGAYTSGTIYLEKGSTFYIYVGGAGSNTDTGGYNGGGPLTTGQSSFGSSGGGATDIRTTGGTWNNKQGLINRIMVAAGGGGANNRNRADTDSVYGAGDGGAGGELEGLSGESINYELDGVTYDQHWIGRGGTQTSGGKTIEYNTAGDTLEIIDNGDLFGKYNESLLTERIVQTGGGSGYYAGGFSAHGGAGGGSSYISGHPGVNSVDASGNHTGTTTHYTGYVFTNTVMIGGDKEMPSSSGEGTTVGNSGDGYARITLQRLVVNQPTSTNPMKPTYTADSNYVVNGIVRDLSGIKSVTVNGEEATLDGINWSYNLKLVANTTTTVTVVATNNEGKTSTMTRYVHYDNMAPTLTVNAPTSTNSSTPTYTTSASYVVNGTASDTSGIKSVTVNGQPATFSGNNWSYNLALGANTTTTVTVVATDNVGRTTTQTRYLFYDSAAPNLNVTAPSTTLTSAWPNYTVTGTTTDASGVTSVVVNGAAASLSGTSFSRAITLSSGVNTVTVTSTDRAGRTTTITRTIYYWNVNSESDMATFAGNSTYINSGLANNDFRYILWQSQVACSKLASSSTAVNIIKSNSTYKTELTNWINASFNDNINLLNYKVGAKTFLYRNGNQCSYITGGFSSPDGFIRHGNGLGDPYNNQGLIFGNTYMQIAPTQPGYFMSAVTNNLIDLSNHQTVYFDYNLVTSPTNTQSTWGYIGVYTNKSIPWSSTYFAAPLGFYPDSGYQLKPIGYSGISSGYIGVDSSIVPGAAQPYPNTIIYSIYMS